MEKRLNAKDVCMSDWIPVSNSSLFDLTTQSVDKITVKETHEAENCYITSTQSDHPIFYDGFILSDTKNVQKICKVTFFRSNASKKYIPRLEFKILLKSTRETRTTKREFVRISFSSAKEGSEEFWKMIAFLYNFKNIVDVGDFEEKYRVLSNNEFVEYVRHKEEAEELSDLSSQVKKIGIDATIALQSATIIQLLKEYKIILSKFVESRAIESDVTEWIDEDNHKYRKSRCLIFGLEFVNHKREGGVSGNRYDILTRIGLDNTERVLIELKSPGDEVFDLKPIVTINDSKNEYSISRSLSHAIPQILEYRKILDNKREGDGELEKIGETGIVRIAKCVIIIGHNHTEDPRWMSNLRELRKSLSSSLEIWTYSDMINKLDSTIQNLEIDTKQLWPINQNNN